MRARTALLGAVGAAALVAPAGAHAAPEATRAQPTARAAQAAELSPQEATIISLVDAYRRSLGLSGLRVYPTLLQEARWYAADMAFNDSFSVTHIDSLGRTIDQRFWDFGYSIVRPLGQSTSSGKLTAEETFEQMRTSRLHDEIMRDPRFRLVGAGYGFNENTDSKAFWVLSFARDVPTAKAKASAAAKKARGARRAKRARKAARSRKAANARRTAGARR